MARSPVLACAMFAILLVGCDADSEGERKPMVLIEAPGARIVVDGEQGIVDIEAGDAKVYADERGEVDIRAPGVKIQAQAD